MRHHPGYARGLLLFLVLGLTALANGQSAGTFTAQKGAPDAWSHIRVTLGNVTNFKTEDRQGWRNNGTGFTAVSIGTGRVTIRIDLSTKGGVSYFDYTSNVSVRTSDGKNLVAEKPTISKDGGNKSYTVDWVPDARSTSVSISVQVTGGNPEFFTYFVSGSIAMGQAPAMPVTPKPEPRAMPVPGPANLGAALKQISEHINQFSDTCFGSVISLGDPQKFQTAFNPNYLQIEDGTPAGRDLLGNRGAKGTTVDRSARFTGAPLPNAMAFPFRIPLADGDARLLPEQKETIWHEGIHQIDSLYGERELPDSKYKAFQERNTEYLDEVVIALKDLAKLEVDLRGTPDPLTDYPGNFAEIANKFADLEKGSAVLQHGRRWPPDLRQLKIRAGIEVNFKTILEKLASDNSEKCKGISNIARQYLAPNGGASFSIDTAGAATGAAGNWNVSFNGYTGAMRITPRGSSVEGQFNIGGGWETMLDLRVEGNVIRFRRAAADQRYSGVIAGNRMHGTFNQGGTGSYVWSGERSVAAPSAGLAPVPPTRVATAPFSIAGRWIINGRQATIEQSGERLVFINEHGQRSSGRFVSSNVVVASEWEGGLEAFIGVNLNGAFFGPTEGRDRFGKQVNEIRWKNGSTWVRQ